MNGMKNRMYANWGLNNADGSTKIRSKAYENMVVRMNRVKSKFHTYKKKQNLLKRHCRKVMAILHPKVHTKNICHLHLKPFLEQIYWDLPMYQPSHKTRTCNHVEISQAHMNNMVRHLIISNYVDTEMSMFANKSSSSLKSVEDSLCTYCTNIRVLLLTPGI